MPAQLTELAASRPRLECAGYVLNERIRDHRAELERLIRAGAFAASCHTVATLGCFARSAASCAKIGAADFPIMVATSSSSNSTVLRPEVLRKYSADPNKREVRLQSARTRPISRAISIRSLYWPSRNGSKVFSAVPANLFQALLTQRAFAFEGALLDSQRIKCEGSRCILRGMPVYHAASRCY
jgi:hypothetical protein